MKNVLFVDDEPSVLAGLRRMLHGLRAEWNMSFAESGAQALELCQATAFDVVVSDMRMPSMDGIEFLTQVRTLRPDAVRIILSGHAERSFILRSVGLAHQFLTKPCSSDELRATVRRALSLRALLANERLARITSRLQSLPPLPGLYLEIQQVLGDPAKTIEDVGRIVARDVALSAKVLQLVNSSFFGLAQPASSVVDATVYLGLDTVSAMVLTTDVFSRGAALPPEIQENLWQHSMRTGSFARTLLKLEKQPATMVEQGFLAGMLHDVGLLVLAAELGGEVAEAWKHARRMGVSTAEGERRVIGASHATIGAYLMGIWGLPDTVIEALAFHHTPASGPQERLSLVTAVHVATALDAELENGVLGEAADGLDLAYLERLGLSARLPEWRAACRAHGAKEAA